jgi:hypothetical protein
VPARRRTIEVIRPDERILFRAWRDHCHGAAPNRSMAHVAMQQNDLSSGTAAGSLGRYALRARARTARRR